MANLGQRYLGKLPAVMTTPFENCYLHNVESELSTANKKISLFENAQLKKLNKGSIKKVILVKPFFSSDS